MVPREDWALSTCARDEESGRDHGRSGLGFRLRCSACVLLIELGSGGQQLGPWRWLPLASLSLGPVHMPQFGRRSELLLRVTALLRLEVVKK